MAESKEKPKEKEAENSSFASYPSETIETCLKLVKEVADQKGTAEPVSRKDIAIATGKAEATIILKVSTCKQYGLFDNIHGKGYQVSKLFQRIDMPESDQDKLNGLLESFG